NIVFSGAQCTGGHGISIGSVGGRSKPRQQRLAKGHRHERRPDHGPHPRHRHRERLERRRPRLHSLRQRCLLRRTVKDVNV
ncbi:hypothetical protein AAVH_28842, partial [Aphelenchoides avenae]